MRSDLPVKWKNSIERSGRGGLTLLRDNERRNSEDQANARHRDQVREEVGADHQRQAGHEVRHLLGLLAEEEEARADHAEEQGKQKVVSVHFHRTPSCLSRKNIPAHSEYRRALMGELIDYAGCA